MGNKLMEMLAEVTAMVSSLQQNNTRLQAEIRELREWREWKPIETAPKDKSILVFDGQSMREGSFEHGKYWVVASVNDPTHWMPLPAPPEEEA